MKKKKKYENRKITFDCMDSFMAGVITAVFIGWYSFNYLIK